MDPRTPETETALRHDAEPLEGTLMSLWNSQIPAFWESTYGTPWYGTAVAVVPRLGRGSLYSTQRATDCLDAGHVQSRLAARRGRRDPRHASAGLDFESRSELVSERNLRRVVLARPECLRLRLFAVSTSRSSTRPGSRGSGPSSTPADSRSRRTRALASTSSGTSNSIRSASFRSTAIPPRRLTGRRRSGPTVNRRTRRSRPALSR